MGASTVAHIASAALLLAAAAAAAAAAAQQQQACANVTEGVLLGSAGRSVKAASVAACCAACAKEPACVAFTFDGLLNHTGAAVPCFLKTNAVSAATALRRVLAILGPRFDGALACERRRTWAPATATLTRRAAPRAWCRGASPRPPQPPDLALARTTPPAATTPPAGPTARPASPRCPSATPPSPTSSASTTSFPGSTSP